MAKLSTLPDSIREACTNTVNAVRCNGLSRPASEVGKRLGVVVNRPDLGNLSFGGITAALLDAKSPGDD